MAEPREPKLIETLTMSKVVAVRAGCGRSICRKGPPALHVRLVRHPLPAALPVHNVQLGGNCTRRPNRLPAAAGLAGF